MSTPPRAPLAGRIVGYTLVVLGMAVTVRLVWQLLDPMICSLSGLLLMAIVARLYLRRFTK